MKFKKIATKAGALALALMLGMGNTYITTHAADA